MTEERANEARKALEHALAALGDDGAEVNTSGKIYLRLHAKNRPAAVALSGAINCVVGHSYSTLDKAALEAVRIDAVRRIAPILLEVILA